MYLDEVEKYFIKKRGKSLIMSPRDWTLVEKWYNMGVPLKIVMQAIDIGFENFLSREENYNRTLNTIKYCEPVVLDLWQQYKENMVGKSKTDDEEFDSKKYDFEKIKTLKQKLENSGEYLKSRHEESILELLRNIYRRINALEKKLIQNNNKLIVEEELFSLQQSFMEQVLDSIPAEIKKKAQNESCEKLKKYKDKMSSQAYKKTLSSLIYKNIRTYYKLPDLVFLA